MTAIADLPRSTTTPTSSDAVPYAKGGTGSAYTFTLAQLLEFFQGNFADPSYTRLTFAPANGATIDISDEALTNLFVVVSPTASPIATLTITLPSPSSTSVAYDGQTIIVVGGQTGAVTALTFNGGSTVSGAPLPFASDGGLILRYDATGDRWTCIGSTAGASGNVSLGSIVDTNGNEEVKFVATASAVNEWTITNAAAGGTVVFAATGDSSNISARISGKGTGTVTLESGSGGTVTIDAPGGGTANIQANGSINLVSAGVINLTSSGVTSDAVITSTTIKHTTSSTVAAIPSAVTAGAGTRRFITDGAAVATVGTTLTGGGALFLPVYSDGTVWRYG